MHLRRWFAPLALLLIVWSLFTGASVADGDRNNSLPTDLLILLFTIVILGASVVFFYWRQIRRRQDSDQRLKEHTELIRNILDSQPDMVYYKDTDGRYRLCNENCAHFIGRSTNEIYGLTDADFYDSPTAALASQRDKETIERGAQCIHEEWLHNADGRPVLLETRKLPLYSKDGQCTGILGMSRDITESKKAQKNLEHMAHHDVLTGLANRILLNEQLDYALQLAKRSNKTVAVLFIDLDKFKEINDSIGHAVGDLLLKDVAHRLTKNLRDTDICARLGGDEFIVVLTQVDDASTINEKCDQLLSVISQPYSLQGHLLSVFASAGISVAPQHGESVDALIRNADVALHKAKELGRNRSWMYQPELSRNMHSRMSLEKDLRDALVQNDFRLVYQPQFRQNESNPLRVETLLRWPHPLRGLISPHEFIPLAETSGLIMELGLWVLRSACEQFLAWRAQGLTLEKIAVNVSAIQINGSFAESVAKILDDLNFNPQWLELEVTESLMMSGITEVTQQIHLLRNMGVEFSIDDFGTGYSSLSKIKSMPVSVLKIDQSFVRDISDESSDYEIARAIIMMAKSLGLSVVAEGVESQIQEDTLHRLGCDWLQGYFYGNPLSGEEFLTKYNTNQ